MASAATFHNLHYFPRAVSFFEESRHAQLLTPQIWPYSCPARPCMRATLSKPHRLPVGEYLNSFQGKSPGTTDPVASTTAVDFFTILIICSMPILIDDEFNRKDVGA